MKFDDFSPIIWRDAASFPRPSAVWRGLVMVSMSLAILVGHSNAATIVASNTNSSVSAFPTLVSADQWVAQSFTTGSSAGGYDFESVSLVLAPALGAPAGFVVSIYSDSGSTNPGAFLQTLVPVLPGGSDPETAGEYSYLGNLTLDASTQYWIVASGSTLYPNAYQWQQTPFSGPNPAPFLAPGWSINSNLQGSEDAGSSWFSISTTSQTIFAVNVVPEPSLAGLLVGGVLILFFVGSRCRRAVEAGSACPFAPSAYR